MKEEIIRIKQTREKEPNKHTNNNDDRISAYEEMISKLNANL